MTSPSARLQLLSMPPAQHVALLSPADEDAVHAAGLILAAAFDPRTNHLQRALFAGVPLEAVREATRLQMLQIAYRGVRDKEVWAASREPSGPIGAVMIVSPPAGNETRAERPETPYDAPLAAATPPEAAAAFAQLNTASHAAQDAVYAPPKDEGYHVSMLGTAPDAQRRGLGGALVRSLLRRAAAEGRQVTLSTHTPENAEYYARLGFAELARNTFDVRGTPVTFWIMAKAPATE